MRQELLDRRRRQLTDNIVLERANAMLIEASEQRSSVQEAIDLDVEEPDHKMWRFAGRNPKELTIEQSRSLRHSVFLLYHTNPHVRGIIDTLVKFIFGRGVDVEFDEEDQAMHDNAVEYWEQFEEDNVWEITQLEMGTRLFRDGEVFLHIMDMGRGKSPLMEFIDPDDIHSNRVDIKGGIELDPKTRKPLFYYVWDWEKNQQRDRIPASKMVHMKAGVDSNVLRGRPPMEAVLKHIKYYDDWLQDRMTLNKIRTAVALVRKIEGTPGQVRSIVDKNRDKRGVGTNPNRQKMLRPGTVLTARPGVSYEMVSANINAGDVAEDGRNILLAIAAGIGFPEMFLTADFSNANFASTQVAQNPVVREFERHQQFFTIYIRRIINIVVSIAKKNGDLPQALDSGATLTWPPLIHRDLKQLVDALSTMFNQGVLSKTSYAARAGFNYDDEQELLANEDNLPEDDLPDNEDNNDNNDDDDDRGEPQPEDEEDEEDED